MASVTGLFRRGASYYLKVVLPLHHPARERYRSGRQVVSLGACTFREAVHAATIRRAEVLAGAAEASTRAASVPPEVRAALPTLRAVYGRWAKSKATRSADSIAACERALRLFEGFAGNLTLDLITRELGDGFRAWLQDAARSTTTKTARDRFTWLKSLLKYAHRDLGLLQSSPWAGLDIETRTTCKRRPWSVDEVRTLLNQPLYTIGAVPVAWNAGREAAYWLPLLALYSGARLGELAQLTPADVREEDGIRYLDLNDDANHKRIKSDAGRRRVPIHRELLRLGFIEYVEGQRGQHSLWPELRHRAGKPGGYFSAWFASYRQSLGLGQRPDFHCLRHTARTLMARQGLRVDCMDAVLGHEPGGSTGSRVYTHRSLAELQAVIEALPGTPTAHLAPLRTVKAEPGL